MDKKILFLVLLGVLVLPGLAFADTPELIQTMVGAAIDTAFFIASGVVVILWIVTGFLFLSAQGQPEKLSSAKKALIAAISGTLLIIVAASAISLVGGAFGLGGGDADF